MASEKAETYDHEGKPVKHARYRVNGIRQHFITAGSGPPLLLLHGTPKDSFYWYKVFPLLTSKFTVVAPDLRGQGYSDKPPTEEGYDVKTQAKDVTELMTQLGHEKFYLHGEDRGAEYAFAIAGLYRERVIKLSFCEMLPCGLGYEESARWTPESVTAQYRQEGVWCWHLSFFWIPHIPEMLISGHDKEFWEAFMKEECYDPLSIEPVALNHWVEVAQTPGCLRGILETYRAAFKNAEINKEIAKNKLTIPVLTIGAPDFFGPMVKESALKFANNVVRSELFEECGHSLSLEKPERVANTLKEFFLDETTTKA